MNDFIGCQDYSSWFDMDGNKITFEEFIEKYPFNTHSRRVAFSKIEPYRVSTVLLGLNHNFFGEGAPLIFETMIFKNEGWEEVYMDRYATKQEALIGHEKACEYAKELIKTETTTSP